MSEQRDAFVQKLKAKIDEWNAEIDRLNAKAEQVEAEAKMEYLQQVEEIKKHRDDALQKMEKLQEAGEGAWEDMKSGVEMAVDSMIQAVKSARERFR
ncbi:hypothetical protein [Desulfonatronospira sp.]|uniref:hypothetical protein n=1 Tax=Desulfonatronospira sp. TaxID=1962951 RepID=UPI0025C6705D|nr:hypothetical protein [Desulfonatronospira sp.]